MDQRQLIFGMAKERYKRYSVSVSSHLIESTPLLALFETTLVEPLSSVMRAVGMPFFGGEHAPENMADEISASARVLGAAVSFGGLTWLYQKGRNLSQRVFNVATDAKEKIKFAHDSLYLAAFCGAVSPPFYYVAGERDLEKIVSATALSVTFGLANGYLIPFVMDVGNELTGYPFVERPLPTFIRQASPKAKKGMFAGALLTSALLTAGIYALTPDTSLFSGSPTVEQTQEGIQERLESYEQ